MTGDKTDGVSRGLFQQAVEHFTRGRHAEAADILAQAAESGDAEARNLLGVMYLNGLGVPQEPRRAAGLFSAAAEQGLKEARYNLCNLLYNGLGIGRDDARAQQAAPAAHGRAPAGATHLGLPLSFSRQRPALAATLHTVFSHGGGGG